MEGCRNSNKIAHELVTVEVETIWEFIILYFLIPCMFDIFSVRKVSYLYTLDEQI